MHAQKDERGFALLTVLMLAAMVTLLLTAHFLLTRVEMSTTLSSMDGTRGFYAAEAGLNIRAEAIRNEFLGYNRPSGRAPLGIPGELPCRSGDLGTGDMACSDYHFKDRDVLTYVDDDLDDDEAPDDPDIVVIPPGERFQGLTAQEYTFAVSSLALDDRDHAEAILDMHFKSRLVPLFQFAVFYDKDLEILPGPPMTLNGPVHTNGNLFLQSDPGSVLMIDGQVTTAGQMYHGRKSDDLCEIGDVVVHDLAGPLGLPSCSTGFTREIARADVDGTNPPHRDWQQQIRIGEDSVTVPAPGALDPLAGRIFWDKADLRIMLDVTDAARPARVHRPDGSVDNGKTADLRTLCGDAVWSTSGEFENVREGRPIEMLEIHVQNLMDCIDTRAPNLMGGRRLDDDTEGGLVWYFGVDDGVNDAAPNNYGVRVRGGATLAPPGGGSDIKGLTIVTNQAAYLLGDYNADDGPAWRPAAILADSLNVLSNNWDDASSGAALSSRLATSTTIRAAFLAGTDTSGGPGGEGLLDTGEYNGGLEDYPRFHENWQLPALRTLVYRGSFVSLNRPLRVDGPHSAQSYEPPRRDWGYETRFNDATNLPPLTPRFVYLRQELFVRQFDY